LTSWGEGENMDFQELKKRVEKDIELKKPEFVKDTSTSINIGELDLGPTQKLLFSISSFRDKNYIDIRTWFQDQSGEWKPTKKGVHFNIDKFEDFKKMVEIYTAISDLDS
jgi:hypothetical protein